MKEKTPVRRGPGLNYAPSALLDAAKCLAASEASADGTWILVEDEKADIYGWIPAASVDAEDRALLPEPSRGPAPGKAPSKPAPPKADEKPPKKEEGPAPTKGDEKPTPPKKEDKKPTPPKVEEKPAPPAAVAVRKPSGPESGSGQAKVEDAKRSEPAAGGAAQVSSEATGGGWASVLGEAGVRVDLLLLGALPRTKLDSNGAPGSTRYEMNARGAGGRLAVEAGPFLGRFKGRLAYSFVILSGLKPKDATGSVSGQEHDVQLLAGHAFDLGFVRLSPEVGYVFSLHATETGLPGAQVAQFVSDATHAVSLGGSAAFDVASLFEVELELAVILGRTLPHYGLGDSGFTSGVRAGVGLRYAWTDSLSMLVRWDMRQRHAAYSGEAEFERSISEASLSHLDQAISVGAGYAF